MSDTQAQTEPQAERRGPGRPRIPAVIERDDSVQKYLADSGPSAVKSISEALNVPKNLAYLSLWRLRKQGLVVFQREGGNRTWSLV